MCIGSVWTYSGGGGEWAEYSNKPQCEEGKTNLIGLLNHMFSDTGSPEIFDWESYVIILCVL